MLCVVFLFFCVLFFCVALCCVAFLCISVYFYFGCKKCLLRKIYFLIVCTGHLEWKMARGGASATAGEEVEQINSYLSRLGSTTKNMIASGEIHTTHGLNSYCVLKIKRDFILKFLCLKNVLLI